MSGRRMLINQKGQTVVALLIFVLMAITLVTAAVAITAINTRSNNAYITGEQARQNAETGVENAMQSLLRDPNYAGETMTLTDGTATITVSGTTTKTIISQGVAGNFRRTVTATATYNNNILTLTSWSETP